MAQLDQASKEVENELLEMQKATDRLRATFEQYFLGVERRPPSGERDTLKQRMAKLRTTVNRNTELRFRINQLVAKFQTLDTYWTRVCREIEDGTYLRDARKAAYRSQKKVRTADPTNPVAPIAEARSEPASSPPAAQTQGLTEDNIDVLFKTLLQAKRRCKEDTRNLTREALASQLRAQFSALKERYGGRAVEFKVVIREGKVTLKAGPKS